MDVKIGLHSSVVNRFSSLHSYILTEKETISPKPELPLWPQDKIKPWERENIDDIDLTFTNISVAQFSHH